MSDFSSTGGFNPSGFGEDQTTIDLDFEGIKASAGWEPLPFGKYHFVIMEASIKPPGENAKLHQIMMKCKVAEPEFVGNTKVQGKEQTFFQTIPNRNLQTADNYRKAAEFMAGMLEAVLNEKFEMSKRSNFNVKSLQGEDFWAVVTIKPDNKGQPRNNITKFESSKSQNNQTNQPVGAPQIGGGFAPRIS